MTAQESLNAAIAQPVELMAFDSAWQSLFETERDRLMAAMPSVFVEIAHIGSTAVAGLAAKPVIDLLAGILTLAQHETLIDRLCALGYTTSAEFNATLSDRKWLMRFSGGKRTHHLHLVVHGGPAWQERIRFRDALRTNPALAASYAALKSRLASAFANDREAYTQGKTEFIMRALRELPP
ncbi:MAG: GrpB family protein [Pseudomonadota bacterium]